MCCCCRNTKWFNWSKINLWKFHILFFRSSYFVCSDWISGAVRGSWLWVLLQMQRNQTKVSHTSDGHKFIRFILSQSDLREFMNSSCSFLTLSSLLSLHKPQAHLARLSFSASQAKYQLLWKHSLNNALFVTSVA